MMVIQKYNSNFMKFHRQKDFNYEDVYFYNKIGIQIPMRIKNILPSSGNGFGVQFLPFNFNFEQVTFHSYIS